MPADGEARLTSGGGTELLVDDSVGVACALGGAEQERAVDEGSGSVSWLAGGEFVCGREFCLLLEVGLSILGCS